MAVLCSMRDLSFLTRDESHAPCSGSSESWPLGCQEVPRVEKMQNQTREKVQTGAIPRGPSWGRFSYLGWAGWVHSPRQAEDRPWAPSHPSWREEAVRLIKIWISRSVRCTFLWSVFKMLWYAHVCFGPESLQFNWWH